MLSSTLRPKLSVLFITACLLWLGGCASTRVSHTGTSLGSSLCELAPAPIPTVVAWEPRWRKDQKEPQLREEAAARGIDLFVSRATCLRVLSIQRVQASAEPTAKDSEPRLAILVGVRELGPTVTIGGPGVVAGGTEVVLDLRVADLRQGTVIMEGTTTWRDGGTLVIKGVATLPQDMAAALEAALITGPRPQ